MTKKLNTRTYQSGESFIMHKAKVDYSVVVLRLKARLTQEYIWHNKKQKMSPTLAKLDMH